MSRDPSRREVLAAALVGLTRKSERPITGGFVNESQIAGHKIRDHVRFGAPKHTEKYPIVIVGGGISGLSAAWWLEKQGFRDFVLLEMEPQAGGNARSGQNEITAYPWAAHYLPIPNREATYVRELMEEFGVIEDGRYRERYLCFSPQERLFLHGRWQDGIEPESALATWERNEFKRFGDLMKEQRATGQFTIPMEIGSKPSPLDQVSFEQWLRQLNFKSPYLYWYADYACRDDYGAHSRETSAWAGVHYFASREHDEKGPLVWPEGNGWIAKRLLKKLAAYVRTNAIVYRVQRAGNKLQVFTPSTEYITERVIFGAPTFTAKYVVEDAPEVKIDYSPWFTANVTLDRLPAEHDTELAWDNVIYNSPSLGYVDAMHMSLRTHIDRTVWTYYWALADGDPRRQRQWLLDHDWAFFREMILNDLARAHPDIRDCVSRIDVMRLGHAMARPIVGSIFAADRLRLADYPGPVYYANSDVSGFSIFEEAQYRGIKAAQRALRDIGRHG